MTEYIIIVALIAIGAIVAVGAFGTTVRAQFASMSQELVGDDGKAAITATDQVRANAVTKASTEVDLKNYND